MPLINMVPGAGLEPAQSCDREILSLLCLPISPPGHRGKIFIVGDDYQLATCFREARMLYSLSYHINSFKLYRG